MFTSVSSTFWPWRTWMNGAGAPPLKAQALYFDAGCDLDCLVDEHELDRAIGPAGAGGSVAFIARCFLASVSAFVGAWPAKLAVSLPTGPPLMSMPGMDWPLDVPLAARFASFRASRAEKPIHTATEPTTTTRRPRSSANAAQ